MSFDHSKYRAHLLRQSLVASGHRGRAARALEADTQARRVLGDRYLENTAMAVSRAA